MEERILLVDVQSGIARMTLNRPTVMNALNFELLLRMKAEFEAIRFDPSVRVVLIRGAGEKAFCSGADLKERATFTEAQVKCFIHTIRELFALIEAIPKPVIAGINGIALGGGTELALASDIRIASRDATMGLTETRLAIIPGAGGTQRLPRLIGKGKAKELIFTGRRVDAGEALAIGLVNAVCDPEQLDSECERVAEMILQAGPLAVEQAKYAIDYGMETDLHTGLAIESNAYWVLIPSEDRREGLLAFKEKRQPIYQGK